MKFVYDMCQITGHEILAKEKDYKVKFELDPNKWSSFSISKEPEGSWEYVKYLNSEQAESDDYKAVTDCHGGIFIWMIKPSIIPIPNFGYIAYIGMSENNLRNSINSFKNNVSTTHHGMLSEDLFDIYSSHLFVAYYKSDDYFYNKELLRELVDAIQPPIQDNQIEVDRTDGMEAF